MKKIFQVLLMVGTITGIVYGIEQKSERDINMEHIAQEFFLLHQKIKIFFLDQIMENAQLIVKSSDLKSRQEAKIELAELLQGEALDEKIKLAIKNDIQIIQQTTDKNIQASQEAYTRLVDITNQIKAQAAHIIAATKEAIKKAQQKIEDAKQNQQSMIEYLYSRVKGFVTTPLNYVFGQKESE
ncbi:MAG TPA: hypothetical protein VLB80_03635 [Candidatus Babeliales bacterium]|nr:hypothetical protein [Candidatus Babeliales bacterium]